MNKDLGVDLRQYECEIKNFDTALSCAIHIPPRITFSTKRKTKNEVLAVSTNALSTHLNKYN